MKVSKRLRAFGISDTISADVLMPYGRMGALVGPWNLIVALNELSKFIRLKLWFRMSQGGRSMEQKPTMVIFFR